MTNKVLILGDDLVQLQDLQRIITGQLGYGVETGIGSGDMAGNLRQQRIIHFDVAVINSSRPLSEIAQIAESLRSVIPHVPVIIITDLTRMTEVKQDIHTVADILIKPVALPALRRALANAMLMKRQRDYISWLEQTISGHVAFKDVVGNHPFSHAMKNAGKKAAEVGTPLTITGESGSGKELLARAIHGSSPRAGKPFVAVSCDTLPAQNAEAILFGREAAAGEDFLLGKLREADGGTLLIKQPELLAQPVREKLLAAMDTKIMRPLSGRQDMKIDVRFIFTQRDGDMRKIQPLGGMASLPPISVPALRDRAEDVPLLAQHFLALNAASEQKYVHSISQQASQWLLHHPWPGNVGQLAHVIRRAVMLCESSTIELSDIKASAGGMVHSSRSDRPKLMDERGVIKPLRSIEEEAIRYALEHCGGSMTGAARSLGIGRSTLYRKVSEMDINTSAYISRANQTTRPIITTSSISRS